jgi:hypothetical protein
MPGRPFAQVQLRPSRTTYAPCCLGRPLSVPIEVLQTHSRGGGNGAGAVLRRDQQRLPEEAPPCDPTLIKLVRKVSVPGERVRAGRREWVFGGQDVLASTDLDGAVAACSHRPALTLITETGFARAYGFGVMGVTASAAPRSRARGRAISCSRTWTTFPTDPLPSGPVAVDARPSACHG